jgi:deoxyadenosine/deoxycytidine kinase
MEKARYIAIEGPIGVGKTSLAEHLAIEFNGRTILEDVESNPFLAKFYSDRKKYAFQIQLFFLLNRYQQQKNLGQQELFNSAMVSDYLFAKDRIFAYLNLDENELALYEQIYRLLNAKIPKPDLVIFLQASTEVLIERIKKRSKSFEMNIEEEYIEDLVDAYNKYFFYYNDSPLLVINSTDIDFVSSRADLSDLVKEIRSMRGGVQHYIPLGSRR